MRGIQVMYVSPAGDVRDKDDLVKDLEHWFEDHRQMCRLISTTLPHNGGDAALSLERLTTSADLGQRLLMRLKRGVQDQSLRSSEPTQKVGRIPLSGGNRFGDPCAPLQVSSANAGSGGGHTSGHIASPTAGAVQPTLVSVSGVSNAESPTVLPSRTYLKKR